MGGKRKKLVGARWIALAFLLMPPLGMALLGARFMQNRQASIRNGTGMVLVTVAYIAPFALFLLFDYEELAYLLVGLVMAGAGSISGLVMAHSMIRRGLRDKKYIAALERYRLVSVQDIAETVRLSAGVVQRDLKSMIAGGVFPDAELDTERDILCLDKRKPVERIRMVRCSRCGAAVVAAGSKSGVCEYCGAPVNY